jgi:hypothetical protein
MQLEAQEKLAEAAEYYDYVLSQDESNLVIPPNFFQVELVAGVETSCGPTSLHE